LSHLAVFLFGPPHLDRDGESINVDTRKAIALLAYLAVTKQRHSRDALAALLWPDYDQPHARATLRRTLSALNKALAGNWLSIDRETVGLTPGASFWLDIDEFNQQLTSCQTHGHTIHEVCPDCLEPLTQAVKLYRADFMAGFNLQDSATFDDWQFFQSDGLRRELANVLERLVLCYSSKADFATAITYARRWLALDRLHEPAYRCIMQLYSWSGQRAAALQQYQECIHILDQELGVAPLEATTQLYQAIKQNQGPPPPTPVQALTATAKKEQRRTTTSLTSLSHISDTSSVQPAPTSYPLIGRSEEWSAMQNAYVSTFSSRGRVIVLEGEAGIGKTRLAQEFLSFAQDKDAALLIARCYEGETTLAYAPFVTGLRLRMAVMEKMGIRWQDQIAAHWLSEAARLLPELHRLCPDLPPTPPLDSPGAQARFFEGLRQFLLALFHAEQTAPASILFIDDVQWADAASLDFLSYLVRRLHEHPLCLLLTWRTTQTPQSYRLHQLLATAHRAGQATQLQLARLNPATVKQLVQAAATPGLSATNGLAERLYQETEGLPLFLTEYLTAITHGMLEAENDYWSLPGGVRDLLTSRLSAVGETSRQLLSTAAVIGRSFDFDTLREASGRSEEETVTALEELINHSLVAEIRGHQQTSYAEADTQEDYTEQFTLFYDFSHEKLRTLVYEATSLARRRLLHRRIAEALVAHMRRYQRGETRAGKIAYHYQMAGNLPEAAHYYFRAGEYALALYAYNEALAHFHAALAAGHSEIARIHETIGDLHTLLGIYSTAITYYKTAATRCNGAALATIQHKLGTVHERRGEWEQAEHYYAAALETLGNNGSPDTHARIYADWSLSAYHCHQNEKALDMAQQALHLAEGAQDMRSLAQAHNMLGILASSNNNLTQATHHLEQSLALAENLQDTSIRAAALNNLAQVYKANGSLQQAINLTRSALTLSITYGDRHREAALHNNLADLLYAEGQLEDSMYHLKRAVSIYAEIGVEAGTVQPEIWKLTEW
jgi:predicted ATPase/DNA-binding SARP family transcriptional activator